MADRQTYGHSDIERYLQHKMTQQEMYNFEKALMNDPFLADALEGYSRSDAALAGRHLSDIESRLSGRKEKVKVVVMPLQKTGWWKIAAVVLAVASGGIFTYSLLTTNTVEKNVAQRMSPAKATEMASGTDSIEPVEKPLAQVEVLPKKELLKSKRTTSPVIRQPKTSPGATGQSEELKAGTATSSLIEKNEGSAALMDKNADLAAAAEVRANADTRKQILEARRSTSPALAEDPVKGKAVDTSDKSLRSKAVVPEFNPKKVKSGVKHLREKTANGAEPVGGWENFERYVNERIDSLKLSDSDTLNSKNIELQFSIDEQGRPADINILQNLDSLTTAQVIQILINGPDWKSKRRGKKVKVIIGF